MPWETFTADHVIARLYEDEAEAYRQVSGDDHVDRLEEVVKQTCNKVRGAILSNPQVTLLGEAGTIPSFFVFDAAVIARTALIGLSPVQEGVTDPRRDEYQNAMTAFRKLEHMNPKAFSLEASASSSPGYGGDPKLDF